MKIRAILVDDEPLALLRLRDLLASDTEVDIVAECAGGREAIEAISRLGPDVVFLDIRMPDVDGFAVLEQLKKLPWVVFLTAFDEYAVKAFEARALDYLLKPATRARVAETLRRVRERIASSASPDVLREWLDERARPQTLVVRDGARTAVVAVSEIDWIESAGNYAILHAGGANHVFRETMAGLEATLPQREFCRISRGAIVNLSQVRELRKSAGRTIAVLENGTELLVTKPIRELESRLLR